MPSHSLLCRRARHLPLSNRQAPRERPVFVISPRLWTPRLLPLSRVSPCCDRADFNDKKRVSTKETKRQDLRSRIRIPLPEKAAMEWALALRSHHNFIFQVHQVCFPVSGLEDVLDVYWEYSGGEGRQRQSNSLQTSANVATKMHTATVSTTNMYSEFP